MKLKCLFLYIFLFGKLFFSYSQNKQIVIYSKDSLQNSILQKINTSKTLSYSSHLKSIRKKLTELGFLNYEMISKTENDSLILINYSLNKQIKEFRIKIRENKLLAKYIDENKILKIDDVILVPFKGVSDFLENIVVFYETKGYSFAKVKLTNIKFNNKYAIADVQIDISKERNINKVIVKGYDKFPEKFIRNHLNINENTIFSKKELQRIHAEIQTISFVKEIKKPEVLFKKDSTLLYIYLKKERKNQLDGVLGMYTDDYGKMVFNGRLKLALRNVFHKGEQMHLYWRSDESSKKLEVGIQIPYVFSTRLIPKFNFMIFSQDSSFIKIASKLNIEYPLNNKNSIGGVIHNEKSTVLNKEEVINSKDYNIIAYGINYKYNTKINSSNNTDIAYIEYTYGKQKTRSTNIAKHRIWFNADYTVPINAENSILIKNKTSLLISEKYLNNELNLIGGNNSIRGFQENSIPVSKYSLLQVNYKYHINNVASIYSITDYAYVKNDYLKTTNSIYSIGLGYKTNLNSALLDINYSLGIVENQAIQINNATLHISYTNTF